MDPEIKSLNFILLTKYVIQKEIKFSHCETLIVLIQCLSKMQHFFNKGASNRGSFLDEK